MNVKQSPLKIIRIRSLLLFLFILATATSALAASVTIHWRPNYPEPEGYRVFARRSDQLYNYFRPDCEGTMPTCIIDDLEDQTEYYFVVQAYDGIRESETSKEIHHIPADNTNLEPMTDGHSISDDGEVDSGERPSFDDADGNLDQEDNRDGLRAEWVPGDPDVGPAPLPPEPLFPTSYSRVKCNPRLIVDDFSDIDDDVHVATQWQIYDNRSGDCLLDLITDRRLTHLNVPDLLLSIGRRYHWRVRFFDGDGMASLWSDITYFTTEATIGSDFETEKMPSAEKNEWFSNHG